MQRTVRGFLHWCAGRIALFTHPGVSSEVEVRTEIDWKNPHRFVVSAPVGTVALVKAHDEAGNVVDLALEPVIAFALERYEQKTTRIRNQYDRDVAHGWYTQEAEPIVASETFPEDIIAVAHVLPDGSAICNGFRYASVDEMLDARREAFVKEKTHT
ncbi:hypothetical protein [Paraburkholderia sacchari]|uniref:hypothetical protein n=1 Tax=Paraburkholderia sacchari TaxID=159450 RepID=UPI0039A5C7B3